MKIINYGHACFKIIDDDISVILDPYQNGSVPGMELAKNITANYVFASHDHFDHNATELIKLIPTDKKLNMVEVVLPHDKNGGKQRGMSVARVFKFSDYVIAHMGDIGDLKAVLKHKELKNIDIVLCPINGFYTISAEDAIELAKKMNWKLLIPIHYQEVKKGTGYPDGNQIQRFIDSYHKNELLAVNDYQLIIDSNYLSYKTIILTERKEVEDNND